MDRVHLQVSDDTQLFIRFICLFIQNINTN